MEHGGGRSDDGGGRKEEGGGREGKRERRRGNHSKQAFATHTQNLTTSFFKLEVELHPVLVLRVVLVQDNALSDPVLVLADAVRVVLGLDCQTFPLFVGRAPFPHFPVDPVTGVELRGERSESGCSSERVFRVRALKQNRWAQACSSCSAYPHAPFPSPENQALCS